MNDAEKPHSPVRLVVMRGPTKGKVIHVEEGENLIGRWDPEAGAFPEIDLDSDDVDAKISRKHAIIERRGKNVFLTDIGSLNGTFVNRGQRLGNGEKHQLAPGDEIIIGKTFLKLEIDR